MNRRTYIAVSALLVVLLTACSPGGDQNSKGPEMTPEDVEAQITDLYEASAAAIAPDGWKVDASW